jgi:hypothetical protein
MPKPRDELRAEMKHILIWTSKDAYDLAGAIRSDVHNQRASLT